MAEGLGFEPSHNGFRDRRATATLALSIYSASERLNAGLLCARETNSHRLEKFKDTPAIIS